MYIRQQCLYSFEEALKLQAASKLEKIMLTLDLQGIIEKIPCKNNGPKGYYFESKLRALIAARIEQIPNTAALVRRLKTDPQFRFSCGFEVIGSVPSEATFSRFIKQLSELKVLEQVFNSLVNKAETMDLIDSSIVAIDSSKLKAYEKSKPKKYLSLDGKSADWGAKRDTDGNKIKWFGYKVHISTDTKSEIPLACVITPASVHDSQAVELLMDKTNNNINTKPKYWVMDSAYDKADLYQTIKEVYHAQAIIPLNTRGAIQPPSGFDFNGTPICSAGYQMVYWGSYEGVNKFRCPHVLGKCDCAFGSTWCSESNYGMLVKTKTRDDPRLFCTPHRGTANWKRIYNKRTGSERCFGRLKEHLGLKDLNLQGISKVETHVYLNLIALVSTVIAVNTQSDAQIAA